jgi:DHA2 family multidrug resistance protein
MMGVILYALVALQPQFLQMLMGYDALQAGLAVSTRGIGAVIAMAMIGRLTQWVDNRALIAGGFVMLAFATLMFGDIDLSIARSTLDTANILSGMSIGFLFVPISVVALGTLRPERIGGATGVFNLVRNLGGSIGISVATALVTRGAQAHQALLAGRLASDQPAYRHFLAGQEALLAPGLGSATAARQAVARAYAVLVQQATLFAYVDTFRWLALLCLLSVPLALLLRRVTRGRGPVAAH